MTTLTLLFALLGTPSPALASPPDGAPPVEKTVHAAVRAAGMEALEQLELRFVFRGTPYRLWLDGQRSIYLRDVAGPDGLVRTDRLEGDTFTSTVAGGPLQLSPDQAGAVQRSLNSVAYFALLPRPLQDRAVVATPLGVTKLGGKPWDTVEVRFREEGGGDDHDDVYRYWFDPETRRIGYLAYTFATGKGGVRVRKVIHTHEVDGLVLYDWANHGRNGQGLTIDQAVRDLEAGTLPQLSTIELEKVEVVRGAPAP